MDELLLKELRDRITELNKKLADEGMKPYQIGKELNVDDNWVRAHLNVFLFPEDIQEATSIAREAIARKLNRNQIRDIESGTMKEWTMRCISDKDWQALKGEK